MNLLLFDKKKFDRLYNCTLYDAGYFDAVRTPNAFVGTLYIFAGIAYELLYIPCLITMSKEKFLKSSCYKFMFFLGIIDILTIPFNATLYGWFALQGGVFCDNPMLEYFAGALTTALWCAASMTCVLLAINRLCDLATGNLMQLFFSGNRTYFWCILPVIYFYYFFMYTKPFMFTSAFYAGFSNPYVGTTFQAQTDAEYMNLSLIIHNIVIPISMVLIYTFICAVMIYKTMKQKSTGEIGLSKHQKTAIIQSSLLCSVFVMAPVIYDYMNYFGALPFMVVIGQICWQSCHGSAVIIYLIFNKSLRDEMYRTFVGGRIKVSASATKPHTATASGNRSLT